ncbi:uncharacterized protein LOC131664532 [Phymastichus coffea]|uniref:uncharacterized protein LOC131664532 n=1 Tax=Phymastichus coffea TaxID=108790 RepID=UPI00273C2448|nr:uncharacterized protein LOC131664532 [Phymastichus coffea]
MADSLNINKYLEEQKNVILKNIDNRDFLCGDEMFLEKRLMSSMMENMDKKEVHHQKFNKKLALDMELIKNDPLSIRMRNAGNRLFRQKSHNELDHRKILAYYNQSIAAAPNDSEELELGYSNRAALLLHLQKYKECLQDCDRALSRVKSNQLKIKLMFRKTEALIGLKDFTTAEAVLFQANCLLKKTNLDFKQSYTFERKSEDFERKIKKPSDEENINNVGKKIKFANELPSFEPNVEAPSASEAVAIKYNEKWGRHIVATRHIEAGEILVRENSYYSFIDPSEMWLFCSFCTKPSWSLMPCKGCIFDVYCSDKCQLEANKKYHKFECPILPFLCQKDDDHKFLSYHVRFMLIAVNNTGSINQLKEELIAAHKSTDPRKKGFMEDDIFHSDAIRSYLSFPAKTEECDYVDRLFGSSICYAVYHLATKTDFFGKKYDITPLEMMSEPNMFFFAALMFRQIVSYNSLKLQYYHPKGTAFSMGITLHPFCSFFNNSCKSNADYIFTEDNEIIVYANQPIDKGSQIFINYYQHDILLVPKDKRNSDYNTFMKFTCKCVPCIENWSNICLPFLKDLLETAPDILSNIEASIKNVENQIAQDFVYNQDLINEVSIVMKKIAEEATVNCYEYRNLEKILNRILAESFGKKSLEFLDCC